MPQKSYFVRYLRSDSAGWAVAATQLAASEAEELAAALRQLAHIAAAEVAR